MPCKFGKVELPEIKLQHYPVGSQVAVKRDRTAPCTYPKLW